MSQPTIVEAFESQGGQGGSHSQNSQLSSASSSKSIDGIDEATSAPGWLVPPLSNYFTYVKQEKRQGKQKRVWFTLRCTQCATGEIPRSFEAADKEKRSFVNHLKVIMDTQFPVRTGYSNL